MKRQLKSLIMVLVMVVSLFPIVQLNPTSAAGGNSLLQGSNLGVWGVNADGSINDPFMNNSAVRTKASAVIGIMRFSCRNFNAAQLQSIANKIKNAGIEPLAIVTSKDQSKALMQINALKDIVTYFEFGNENNYFDGWSGSTYASHWTSDIPLLRAAAPNAKFGGPVGSNFKSDGSIYLRDFLDGIKGNPSLKPDFISMHKYNEHGEDTSNQAVLDSITNEWGPGIDRMKSDIQAALGTSVNLAITEWNWDAAPENTGDNRDNDATFMNDYTFKVLNLFKTKGIWMAASYDFAAGAGGGHLDMVTPGGAAKPMYNAFVNWKALNPPGTTTTTRHEGETATGVNQVATWPNGYSGTGIGVKYPGSSVMTWSKNFAGGTYNFSVKANDYSGTQTFYIQLDGVNKGGPYTMIAGDKSWKTFTGSLGTVSAGTHTIGVKASGTNNVYIDYVEVTGP
jgi:hypothetical protein